MKLAFTVRSPAGEVFKLDNDIPQKIVPSFLSKPLNGIKASSAVEEGRHYFTSNSLTFGASHTFVHP